MLDFFTIGTRTNKSGTTEVYPKFIMKRSEDLMTKCSSSIFSNSSGKN